MIVLANLAPETQSQALELGELVGEYVDWFTGDTITLTEGIAVELEANSFQVLVRNRP